jgi:hypothetical protein
MSMHYYRFTYENLLPDADRRLAEMGKAEPTLASVA